MTKRSKDRPLPPHSRKQLAGQIAQSLALVAWHGRGIGDCLHRRLPTKLHRFTQLLTAELLEKAPGQVAPTSAQITQMLTNSLIFERIHRYCDKRGLWPNPDLQPAKMHPIDSFARLPLPQLATLDALTDWLLLTPEQLDYFSDRTGRAEDHGDMAVNHYHYHTSPKSTGGQRLIEAPKPRLKTLQRQILQGILSHVPPHPDACGFIAGRNCINGAARHVGEAVVVSFDLRDFFNGISAGRVFGLMRCLGYPPNVAHALTGLCTVITPARVRDRLPFPQRQMLRTAHLPQGAPTSPMLANLVAHGLDRRLAGLARSLGASYSRYADDISFAGDGHIGRTLLDIVPVIVADEGFALNPAKTRVMPRKTRQIVTGVVVNDRLNVTRAAFDRLKAVIHRRDWQTDPHLHSQLLGQIGWVAQVNPAKGAKLRQLMDRAAI